MKFQARFVRKAAGHPPFVIEVEAKDVIDAERKAPQVLEWMYALSRTLFYKPAITHTRRPS